MREFTTDPVNPDLVAVANHVMTHCSVVAEHLVGQWRQSVPIFAGLDNEEIRKHGAFGQFLIEEYALAPTFSSVAVALIAKLAEARDELVAVRRELADHQRHPEDRI